MRQTMESLKGQLTILAVVNTSSIHAAQPDSRIWLCASVMPLLSGCQNQGIRMPQSHPPRRGIIGTDLFFCTVLDVKAEDKLQINKSDHPLFFLQMFLLRTCPGPLSGVSANCINCVTFF